LTESKTSRLAFLSEDVIHYSNTHALGHHLSVGVWEQCVCFQSCFNYLGFQLEEWYVCMDFTLLKGLQAKSMLFKLMQERHHMHFLVRNYHAAFSRFEHQRCHFPTTLLTMCL